MKFTKINLESSEENFYKPIDNSRVTLGTNNVLYWNSGRYGGKYGNRDNSYPDFVIDLAENGTAIHSNIINLKGNLITGDNLAPKDPDMEGADDVTAFIKKRNRRGENLKNVYAQSAKQFALFEMSYLQVVYSKDYSKIVEVYHIPVKDVRMDKPDALGNVSKYFISKKWSDISNKFYRKASISNMAVSVPTFTGKELAKELKQPVQLLCIKKPDYNDFYVTPSYSGGLLWILTSNYIANFHSNNFKNSFLHQGMLVTYGSMSEPEEKEFAENIEELFAGNVTDDKKRMMLANVENKEMTPQFISAQDLMQDKQYDLLIKEANQQVVSAHNCYSILAGLESKGADLGGDSNKLNTALKSFRLLVTDPLKNYLMAGYNVIMEENGLGLMDVDTSNFVIKNDPEEDNTAPDDATTKDGQDVEDQVDQTPDQ